MKKVKENITKQIKIFGANYKLKIFYKYIRKPNLNMKENSIEICLPYKYRKIDNSIIIEILLEKMYDEIAKKELELIMEKVRTTLKFAPEDYKIMRLDKRIAKCLAGRLIINPEIVKYRREIIEYIICYEFCLLKVKRHSKKFYDTLKQYMPNYENYEYELIGIQY